MKTFKILFLLALPLHVAAQISLGSFGSPYVETFGTASVPSWTNNTTFPGWYLQAGGTFTFIAPTINVTIAAPSNTGGFYTYMCNGNNDIKLGGRPSNSSGGGSGSGLSYMGMRLKNTTGATITSLRISFDAFQLSLAQNSCNVNTLDFSYQVGTTVTALTGGAWISVPSLQYTAPNNDCGAGTSNQLAGYPCTISSGLSACINVSIPNNSEIMLRWADVNNAANDPHLAIDNISVTPFRPVTITAGSATTFCQGDSVTLTASGGNSYSWNTGATSAVIHATTSGTYTVTSTNVCQTTTATQAVTVNPLPAPAITAGSATTFCQGDSVTLTASGGTSYVWSTGSTNNSITVATGGTYTVTATNSCGSQPTTQAVTVNPLPAPLITAGAPTTFCQGSSVTLSASGGTSYAWNTGDTTSAITVTTGGTYTVTVTNNCGSLTATQAVIVNPLPVALITAGSPVTFCQGDSVTLSASGGTSYAWNTGDTTTVITVSTAGTYTVTATNNCGSLTATQAVTVNPLPAASIQSTSTSVCSGSTLLLWATGLGNFVWSNGDNNDSTTITTGGTYIVIAANSCGSISDTITINTSPLPLPAISLSGSAALCAGDSVTLTASGGTSYAWSTGDTTSSITVTTAGTYTLTASNNCGSQTATQAITVNALPAAHIHSSATTVCSGSTLLLWATGAGNFTWSNGDNNDSTTVTTGGVYTVTANSSCGSTSDTITISTSALPVPAISLSGSAALCAGDSVTLSASGGTSYLWNTGATGPSITVGAAGTYTVTASNSCGPASATTVITATTSATALVHASATTICPGNSVLLWGSGTGSFSWSTGESNDSIYVTAGGNYVLTSGGSCGTARDSISITQLTLPVAAVTSTGPTTICSGSSVVLNASGGTTYVWQPTGTTGSAVNAITAGTYTVTASNSCGNSSATITVTVISGPTASITPAGPATICAGSSLTLNAGGGSTYVWSTGANTNSINASAAGTYWVIAGNSCGTDTATFSVITESVTASFSSSTNSGQYPLPVDFTNNSSSNAVAYTWSFGDGTTSAAYSPSNTFSDPGTYTVVLMVSSANGCTDTETMQIVVSGDPSTLSIPNVFTPNGDMHNDVFFVTASGIKEFECTIFDRWGVKIAAMKSVSEGWDGKALSGQDASDGTYYYIIKATGTDNKTYDKTGFVTLVK